MYTLPDASTARPAGESSSAVGSRPPSPDVDVDAVSSDYGLDACPCVRGPHVGGARRNVKRRALNADMPVLQESSVAGSGNATASRIGRYRAAADMAVVTAPFGGRHVGSARQRHGNEQRQQTRRELCTLATSLLPLVASDNRFHGRSPPCRLRYQNYHMRLRTA